VLGAGGSIELAPASADASFRRYFRLHDARAAVTRIVMDAPPAHEDCRPFVQVAQLLVEAGVNAPRVLASDLEQGFLLLTDLGQCTYLDALQGAGPGDADALYRDALAALERMQAIPSRGVLPPYDRALLARELDLFPQWYLERHLRCASGAAAASELAPVFERLLGCALAQPAVFVHRDYHCRNLMCSEPNPGVLDFQDAVHGPITYDLVSLFRDAYIDWEEAQVIDWLARYWASARRAGLPVDADFSAFYRDFEWMGVQRHLKVLGIFARLAHRDGKHGYIDSMPRVRGYLRAAVARYADLAPLARWLEFDAAGPA
jgi:N-acetylmuramate 1-kinase